MMKIRGGFVSNSSSGSFIFPESMSDDDIDCVVNQIEEFLRKLKHDNSLDIGLSGAHNGEVNTIDDNSCPYAAHIILTEIIRAEYYHNG
jgi:hypothetical protein